MATEFTLTPDGKKLYHSQTTCCQKPIQWLWGESPKECPYCGDPYWNKPKHEFILFHMQDEFIEDYKKTGSTKILGEKMFPVMQEYAENIIKGLVKERIYLEKEVLEEKAFDAATYLIEAIYRSPDMRMHVSFGDILSRWCKNVTFGSKKHDKTYSLQFILGDDDKEFGDTISCSVREGEDEDHDPVFKEVTMNNQVDPKSHEYSLAEELSQVVRKTTNMVRENTSSCAQSLTYLIGIHNRISGKNEKNMNLFYQEYGNTIRLYIEKGELVVFEYLRGLVNAGA